MAFSGSHHQRHASTNADGRDRAGEHAQRRAPTASAAARRRSSAPRHGRRRSWRTCCRTTSPPSRMPMTESAGHREEEQHARRDVERRPAARERDDRERHRAPARTRGTARRGRRRTSACAGVMSSLSTSFTVSASVCSRPNGPASCGPKRIWMRADDLALPPHADERARPRSRCPPASPTTQPAQRTPSPVHLPEHGVERTEDDDEVGQRVPGGELAAAAPGCRRPASGPSCDTAAVEPSRHEVDAERPARRLDVVVRVAGTRA